MISTATAKTLGEARRLQAQVRQASCAYQAIWQNLALLLTAGLVDMLLPLPNFLRGGFVLGLLARIVFQLVGRRSEHSADPAAWKARLAREIEAQKPELDNALIHAVQFGDGMEQTADTTSAALMRREMERAEQMAARLPLQGIVGRAALYHGRRGLALVLGILILTFLLFPRAYRFEVPRFLLFWSDTPPFTLTDFTVTPTDAHLRSGDNLAITVRIGGLLPHHLELRTGGLGEAGLSAPLTNTESGVYTAELEGLTRDTWFMVVADTGRSARCVAHVDIAPNLQKLTVTLHPPAYSKRKDSTAELETDGSIEGLSGTRVELDAEADRPLAGGELTVRRNGMPGLQIPLVPTSGNPTHATAAFTLDRDGDFRLRLDGVKADGGLQTQATQGKITLLRDETPLVSIPSPGQNVLAPPDRSVPLRIETEDDIAVQKLELHSSVNGGQERVQDLSPRSPAGEVVRRMRLDLKTLRVKAGDTLTYYAVAFDNDPQNPHRSESEKYQVQILTRDAYAQVEKQQRTAQAMMAQYRALVDALSQIADAQKQLAHDMAANAAHPNKAETERLRERQRDLQTQAQDLSEQMRELSRQPSQFDMEKALKRALSDMAEKIEAAQSGAMQSSIDAEKAGGMARHANRAADKLSQTGQQAGNLKRALAALQQVLPLFQDFARLKQLTQEQAKIASQAGDAQKKGLPPNTGKALADRQAQNHDALENLRQNLQTHANDAQSVAPKAARIAHQVAQGIRDQNIGQTMQSAQQAFADQNASQGTNQADTARRALESFFQPGEKGEEEARSALNKQGQQSGMGEGMGDALAQMLQALLSQQGQTPGNGQGQSASGSSPNPGNGLPSPSASGQPMSSPGQAKPLSLAGTSAGGVSLHNSKNGGPRGERVNALSGATTDKTPDAAPHSPNKATDRAASSYPAEYRRLVQDYFTSVAHSK